MTPPRPLEIIYKCPYCGNSSPKQDNILHCQGMCYLAYLVETEMVSRDGWTPPLTFDKFKDWSVGDKHEFVRMLDAFAVKNYTDACRLTDIKSMV